MKPCGGCVRSLHETCFYKDSKAKDGLNPKCKDCVRVGRRNHKDSISNATLRWRESNPETWRTCNNQNSKKSYARRKAREDLAFKHGIEAYYGKALDWSLVEEVNGK